MNEWLRSMGYLYKTGEENRLNFDNLFRNMVSVLRENFFTIAKICSLGVKLYVKRLFPFIDLKPYTHYRFAHIDWSEQKPLLVKLKVLELISKENILWNCWRKNIYLYERNSGCSKKLKGPYLGNMYLKMSLKRGSFSPDWIKDFPDIILQPRECTHNKCGVQA